MTARSWDETRREFCRFAARKGVKSAAQKVPCDRETIYRLMRGETQRPTKAIKQSIERIVDKEQEQKDE
jgi:hypothetical protein